MTAPIIPQYFMRSLNIMPHNAPKISSALWGVTSITRIETEDGILTEAFGG